MSSSDREESSGSTLADAVVAALAKHENAPPEGDAAAVMPGDEVTAIEPRQVIVADGAVAATATVKVEAPESPADLEPDTQNDVAAAQEAQAEHAAAVQAQAAEAQAVEAQAAEAQAAEAQATEATATQTQAAEVQAEATKRDSDAPELHASTGDSTLPPPPETPDVEPEGVRVRYYGYTDVGLVREHNEDNYLVANLTTNVRGNTNDMPLVAPLESRGFVFAVCDGMGGAAAGEVASQMAVDTVHEMLANGTDPRDHDHFARRLVRAVEEAGSRIFTSAKMDRSRRGMGTTATVAGFVDAMLFVGQVGDSRAYVLRGEQFALITKDQSLVNQLIDAGQLTEEQAEAFEYSNIILQALGTTEEVNVDLTFLELRRGDRLLLCSDGLSGLVHVEMMKEVLRTHRDQVHAARQLIAMANSGGGHDNITVIIADFDGLALKEPVPEARVAYQQYPLPPAPDDAGEPLTAKVVAGIKTPIPKPGANTKTPMTAGVDGASSRWWIVAVLVVLVLALFGAIYLAMEAETTTSPETRATLTTAPPPRLAPPETSHLRFDGSFAGDDLEIDGELHGSVTSGGMLLDVSPGTHAVRVLRAGSPVVQVQVEVAPGHTEFVRFPPPAVAEAIPVGVEPPLAPAGVEPPPVEAPRARVRASGENEPPTPTP